MEFFFIWWLLKDADEDTITAVAIVGVIVLVFFCSIFGVVEFTTSQFDTAYDEGAYVMEYNEIPLGTTGQPLQIEKIFDKVPLRGEEIVLYPRQFHINDGCEALEMPKGTLLLRAATDSEFANQITIEVPSNHIGSVVICAPEDQDPYVVIWVVTHE